MGELDKRRCAHCTELSLGDFRCVHVIPLAVVHPCKHLTYRFWHGFWRALASRTAQCSYLDNWEVKSNPDELS